MNRTGLIAALALLTLAGVCGAAIINIPDDYQTIQAGIDTSENGDTVLVQPGRYVENINYSGKNITVGSLFLTTGDAVYIDSTVIDGNRQGSVVRFDSGEDGSSLLIGFTLTNGSGSEDVDGDICGGGIHCLNSSPTLSHLIITGNGAWAGGGVFVQNYENEFTSPEIAHCIIVGNEGGTGGVFLSRSGTDVRISYTLIAHNEGNDLGSGLVINYDAAATVQNTTIADNYGSGINFWHPGGSLRLTNVIVWGDPIGARWGGASLSVRYCDIEGGEDGIRGDGVNVDWGEGNIDQDPLFANPDSGDFHLTGGSPCIDAGDPESPLDPDISRADMGAFYSYHRGLLQGYVYDSIDGSPLPAALLFTNFNDSALTNAEGFYQIQHIRTEAETTLTAMCIGFVDSVAGVQVGRDDTTEVNFSLWHPIPEASPSFGDEVILSAGDSAQGSLTLCNFGNYPLRWTLERRLSGAANEPPPWTRMESIPVSEPLRDTRIQGVVFTGDSYYVAGGAPEDEPNDSINYIYVLDRDGSLTDRFVQPDHERYGIYDLDWDGELIWGTGGRQVFGFTRDGELIRQWDGPNRINQALAWDADRQCLWVCGVVSNEIAACDREGRVVAQLNQYGLRIRGLAWWADDPDGYRLYIFHSPDLASMMVLKMNTDTGDTLFVARLEPEEGGSPHGAFITREYDRLCWVFMGVAEDATRGRIDVWMLSANLSWISLSQTAGELAPDSSQEVEVLLSAVNLDAGIYQADLYFVFPDIHSGAAIPVTMQVTPNGIADCELQIEDFGLGEAYPNPFNSQTAASYQLSAVSLVSLRLYDISGRLVQTVVEGRMETGAHRAVIDGSELASGVYFLKLAAGREVATRKIVCVK
jgi:hypothetical protein